MEGFAGLDGVCPRSEGLTEPEKSVVGKEKTTTPMIDSASDLFKLSSCAMMARAFLQIIHNSSANIFQQLGCLNN